MFLEKEAEKLGDKKENIEQTRLKKKTMRKNIGKIN
jgi:hypothetical protein